MMAYNQEEEAHATHPSPENAKTRLLLKPAHRQIAAKNRSPFSSLNY